MSAPVPAPAAGKEKKTFGQILGGILLAMLMFAGFIYAAGALLGVNLTGIAQFLHTGGVGGEAIATEGSYAIISWFKVLHVWISGLLLLVLFALPLFVAWRVRNKMNSGQPPAHHP